MLGVPELARFVGADQRGVVHEQPRHPDLSHELVDRGREFRLIGDVRRAGRDATSASPEALSDRVERCR
jgi:hypothetical protein